MFKKDKNEYIYQHRGYIIAYCIFIISSSIIFVIYSSFQIPFIKEFGIQFNTIFILIIFFFFNLGGIWLSAKKILFIFRNNFFSQYIKSNFLQMSNFLLDFEKCESEPIYRNKKTIFVPNFFSKFLDIDKFLIKKRIKRGTWNIKYLFPKDLKIFPGTKSFKKKYKLHIYNFKLIKDEKISFSIIVIQIGRISMIYLVIKEKSMIYEVENCIKKPIVYNSKIPLTISILNKIVGNTLIEGIYQFEYQKIISYTKFTEEELIEFQNQFFEKFPITSQKEEEIKNMICGSSESNLISNLSKINDYRINQHNSTKYLTFNTRSHYLEVSFFHKFLNHPISHIEILNQNEFIDILYILLQTIYENNVQLTYPQVINYLKFIKNLRKFIKKNEELKYYILNEISPKSIDDFRDRGKSTHFLAKNLDSLFLFDIWLNKLIENIENLPVLQINPNSNQGREFKIKDKLKCIGSEHPKLEFKQGFYNLSEDINQRKFNEQMIVKLCKEITALANIGRGVTGSLFIGISDKKKDTERIKKIDSIETIEEYGDFGIVGIDREAKLGDLSIGDYVNKIISKIAKSDLDDFLVQQVTQNYYQVKLGDRTVIEFKIKGNDSLSFFRGKLYIKEGSQCKEINQTNQIKKYEDNYLKLSLKNIRSIQL